MLHRAKTQQNLMQTALATRPATSPSPCHPRKARRRRLCPFVRAGHRGPRGPTSSFARLIYCGDAKIKMHPPVHVDGAGPWCRAPDHPANHLSPVSLLRHSLVHSCVPVFVSVSCLARRDRGGPLFSTRYTRNTAYLHLLNIYRGTPELDPVLPCS